MKLSLDKWDISHLRTHIQYAVDLEFWTIPFYLSVMYSIQDRSSEAYQLIRTVVDQEMLHLQAAANIANAYGFSPSFSAPTYSGTSVPHLDFAEDDPDIVREFSPYTATIGPLDEEHINAMCLIEVPRDLTGVPVDLHDDATEYGSIGEFYKALAFGAAQLQSEIRGGVRQVDAFKSFYRNAPALTVTESGSRGFAQVDLLISMITDQGEGASKKRDGIPPPFRNTADDIQPAWPHFEKFVAIKRSQTKPQLVPIKPESAYSPADKQLQGILVETFSELTRALEALFSGENPQAFFPVMAKVGGAIRNCWEHGVTPRFS